MELLRALLLTKEGRIGRIMFLVTSIVWSIVGPVLGYLAVIPLVLIALGMMALSGPLGIMSVFLIGALAFAMVVAYIWVSLNIMAKRLHDFGWSGWVGVGSIVLQVLMMALLSAESGPAVAAGGLLLLVLFVLWLALVLVPGSAGYNDYGRRLTISIS